MAAMNQHPSTPIETPDDTQASAPAGRRTPSRARRRIVSVAAPLASALLLGGVLLFGGLAIDQPAWAEDYHADVKSAINAIPEQVGTDWIGTDDPEVQPAQQRILKPNIIVQRTYRQPGSSRFLRMLVVHCKLASDMNGHYPRICYPNTGWQLESADPLSIRLGTTAIPATHYAFSSMRDGREVKMYIVNFFILPAREQNLAPDMAALEASARSVRKAGLGAAQVQFISDQPLDTEEWRPILERFARAVEGPIDAIVQGAQR
jgi:hypothetical protein